MKKYPLTLLTAVGGFLLISALLISCTKENEDDENAGISCEALATLTPIVGFDPEISPSSINKGRYGIQIDKVEGVDMDDIQVFLSPGPKNYDDNIHWANGPIELTSYHGIYDIMDRWKVPFDFYSTNSEYILEVFFECHDGGTSETFRDTLYSPTLCQAQEEYGYWFYSETVPSNVSNVTAQFDVDRRGDGPLGNMVSEDDLVFRSTAQYLGNNETPYTFAITNTPIIFPFEMNLDLFELTGYDPNTWPASHGASNAVFIAFDLQVCGEWQRVGSVQWNTN